MTELDTSQLRSEADAAIAGAPVDPVPVGPESAPKPTEADVLQGYTLICGSVVGAAAQGLAPAWNVTPEETGRVAGACAQALLLWFPDDIIPPKYMALVVIAGVSFEIIAKRRDETGRLRPRFPPPQATTPEQPAAA
jgi:hypothetical protein